MDRRRPKWKAYWTGGFASDFRNRAPKGGQGEVERKRAAMRADRCGLAPSQIAVAAAAMFSRVAVEDLAPVARAGNSDAVVTPVAAG